VILKENILIGAQVFGKGKIYKPTWTNRLKGFLQRILQEIMKKNNSWNIRHLVNDSFVPSAQRPSVNLSQIDGFYLK